MRSLKSYFKTKFHPAFLSQNYTPKSLMIFLFVLAVAFAYTPGSTLPENPPLISPLTLPYSAFLLW